MPKLVDGTDLIEFTNGVRLTDQHLRKLGRGRSHRRVAEMLGISYLELEDARALANGEPNDIENSDRPDFPGFYKCGCEVVETDSSELSQRTSVLATCPKHDAPTDWERYFNKSPETDE